MLHVIVTAVLMLQIQPATSQVQSSSASQDRAPVQISRGAKIFVDPMDGFGDFFIAALHSKRVPVTIVADTGKASYVAKGFEKMNGSHEQAAIKIIGTDNIVAFACSFDQRHPIHGKQTAAESCANSLKEEMLGS
jgi:hypothetical protein